MLNGSSSISSFELSGWRRTFEYVSLGVNRGAWGADSADSMTYQKKAPANAPPANISSGVTFGVKIPFHLPSKTSRPDSSRDGLGARVQGPLVSYSGPEGMIGVLGFGNGLPLVPKLSSMVKNSLGVSVLATKPLKGLRCQGETTSRN